MKTVFFSIADDIMFKNFAAFPGSVLDFLSQEKDVRIIVVVEKGHGSYVIDLKLGDNVIVEEVKEDLKKTILQRAFAFFHSYLIFTRTTRLVSSYGVRSDIPRPLMRYYNYPLKLFIANVFGKSDWIREKVVPTLYLKIFSSYRPYKHLFEKYHFDLVFMPTICLWPADLEVLVEAKRQKVRTLGMPGNWDHLSKYYIPFKPDRLLVWSLPVKKEASLYQHYNQNIVSVVGAPQVDFLKRSRNLIPREKFLSKFNIPEGSTIILYASQGPYSIDGPDYVDMMLKWIDEGKLPENTYIIIRRHPRGLSEKGMYERFAEHEHARLDESVDRGSLMEKLHEFINVLGQSDIVVTTYSSIATDASIWDKPTIITSFDGYKQRPMHQSVRRHRNFTHFQDVIKTGGVSVTESKEEFLEALNAYIREPTIKADGRERLRSAVFGFFDGKSSRRICKEIVREAN